MELFLLHQSFEHTKTSFDRHGDSRHARVRVHGHIRHRLHRLTIRVEQIQKHKRLENLPEIQRAHEACNGAMFVAACKANDRADGCGGRQTHCCNSLKSVSHTSPHLEQNESRAWPAVLTALGKRLVQATNFVISACAA